MGAYVRTIVLLLAAIVLAPAPAMANTLDQVLQRLDRLENELDRVKKENAALRDRLRRPEAPRQETARPSIAPLGRNVGTDAMAAAAPLYKAPHPVARFSWAGPYVGVHAGATWGTEEWDLLSLQITTPNTSVFDLVSNKTSTHTLNGFLGGVQAGFNWQMDWVVFGAEAQFSWSNASGHGRCIEETRLGGGDTDFKCNTKVDYLGTAAGRLGGSVGSALLYLKGGAAWVHNSYSITSSREPRLIPQLSSPQASVTDTRWGWMLGTGVELAFTANWSAKAEYDYLDFGTKHYTFAAPGSDLTGGGGSSVDLNVDIRQRMHLIKAGLNYRFDYGKTPVRANY